MILSRIKISGLILILFIAGCREKDELTLPVRVSLKMNLKINLTLDSTLNAEYMHFTDCKIGLSVTKFIGRRETGGDFLFDTHQKSNYQVISFLHFSQPITFADFDMPQGTYIDMKWDININSLPVTDLLFERLTKEELLAVGFVDYGDDGKEIWYGPGMVISGTYEFLDGSVIPFLLASDFSMIRVGSFDPDNNSRIVLSVDKEYEASMLITLDYDFSSISRKLFEEAEISSDNGYPIIIVSYCNNEDLYENLISRINLSAKVIIK